MRLEGGSFNQEDIENCDKIADLIQELVSFLFNATRGIYFKIKKKNKFQKEFEVKKIHDELEAETIRTSVFRHKLSFFEKNLNQEIQGK